MWLLIPHFYYSKESYIEKTLYGEINMSIKALNGNLVLKLVEEESKTAGGIVLTGLTTATKNRAVVVDGGASKDLSEDLDAIVNGDVVIFNSKEILENVGDVFIVKAESVLAKVN